MKTSSWRGWIGVCIWSIAWGASGQHAGMGITAESAAVASVNSGQIGQRAVDRDSVLWQVGELLEQLADFRSGESEEEVGGQEESARALAYEYFEQLLAHPLPINRASRRELEQLFILSDFQITSLLTYRREHGDILSGTELALLNGFNDRIANLLRYFVVFETGTGAMESSGNFWRDCRSQLLVKSGINLEQTRRGWNFPPDEFPRITPAGRLPETATATAAGAISPVYTYLKYQCDYLGRFQWGFTLENDAGERFLGPWRVPLSDFFSFHLLVRGMRIGKMRAEVILGDFSARFGQGLTLWKSFQLSGVSSPAGLYKRGGSVRPYTSSDETNFLRGGAVSLSRDFEEGRFLGLRTLEMTGLLSYRGIDARVEDGKYTSVQTGGLHRPGSGEQGRRAMYETLGGLNAVFIFSQWKLGVNWVAYGYDKANGRRVTEYNRYQLYDGGWGNFSMDFYAVAGRFRFFGELAVDYGGGSAGLWGVLFRAGEVELGVLGRSYARGYKAPHAGAYTTTSGCSNQRGITVSGLWNSNRTVSLSGSLECTRYPAPRYRVPHPSWVVGGVFKGEYRRGKWEGYLRFSERFSTDKRLHRLGLKGSVGYTLWEPLRVGVKAEWVTVGGDPVRRSTSSGVCSVDLSYIAPRGKVSLRGGWSWFSAPQWEARLYGYEAGLPGSYGSVLLYGVGSRGYLSAKVRLFPRCEVYGKGSWSGHKKGGGEGELPAPRFRLQMGLKMKF